MSEKVDIQLTIGEADIDLLLAEEFGCSPNFRSWFYARTGSADASNEPPLFVGRGVSNYHGENDLLVVHRGYDGRKRALLIENKIAATPTRIQGERYRVRGQKGIDDGVWDNFVTVLVAPEKYLTHTTLKFEFEVSYEAVLSALKNVSDPRVEFKRTLIEFALARAKKPWKPTVDEGLTGWFRDARKFAEAEFPDLPLRPEDKGRAPTSTWITFSLNFPMSRVDIEIKPHRGHVDLRFQKVELGEMRRVLAGRLPNGADTLAAKHSCAVRLVSPSADVRLPFETQRDRVRPMMAAADLLLRFALREKSAITKLLGYEDVSVAP